MAKSYAVEVVGVGVEIVEGIAAVRGLSPEHLLADIVAGWVSNQIVLSDAVLAMREIPHPKVMREKDYEIALAGQLIARGLDVLSQVRTGRGTADLVVANAVVVEVKLDVRSWRDIHQAQGQADAYASALGLKHAIVCAPGVAEEFRSASVCDVSEAAGVIAALCHVNHPA